MEKRTIDGFARVLAEQMCEESWGKVDAYSEPRSIAVDDLVKQIKGYIRQLDDLGAIRPRHPVTGAPGDPSSAPDGTYTLTRTDADRVIDYIRGDAQSRRDFSTNFAKWKAAGRYTLKQAADILETEAGERYETILERLMEAARNGALQTYESGWSQPIKYSSVRPVRETDEVLWFKFNSWLAKAEITARVRPPIEANVPAKNGKIATRRNALHVAIDKAAIDCAGTLDTISVWLVLKEMAIAGESPFTGVVVDDELFYTGPKNKVRSLTKKALGQRLKRRATGDTSLKS
jgi:hypothetical protein